MPIAVNILEDRIETEHGICFVQVYTEPFEDSENRFQIFIVVRGEQDDRLHLHMRYRVSVLNPVGIDDIAIGMATLYGLCLSRKLTSSTLKAVLRCYRNAKRDFPDDAIGERLKRVGECLKKKGPSLRSEFEDALIDCSPAIKDIFADDDDDNDQVDET